MRSLIYLIYLICFSVFVSQSISQTSLSDSSNPPESPLSLIRKHDTALIAAPDGTIYLVELASGEVLWSFDSGPPIYSSYQAISLDRDGHNYSKQSYVDCGDDWELYMHGNGLKQVKLPFSVEEFIRRTPYISAEGGVMLGTKKSTVFVVDAKTGKLIYTIKSDASGDENSSENLIVPKKYEENWLKFGSAGLESVDQLLYITRTDYGLKYTSLKTGKEIWYLMFADIEASYRCQGIHNFFSEGDVFDPEYKGVNCQARPLVFRIRDYSSLESIFGPDGILNSRFVDGALSLTAPVRKPLLEEHKERLPDDHQYRNEETSLALRSTEIVRTGMLSTDGRGDISETNIKWMVITAFVLVLSTGAFVFWRSQLAVTKQNQLEKEVEHAKMQAKISKKKKIRKSAINNRNRATTEDDERNIKQLAPNSNDGFRDGRKIGKLVVTNKEIAKGSNGTIILEGTCDGRSVAVKRLVKTHHDVALKEIQNLIASDHHPNIIRWYGVEYDQDFVYLALERCACNLHDFILSCAASRKQGGDCFNNFNISLQSNMEKGKNYALWKANGFPSPLLLKVMWEIVCGVAHLHELGIIHRDLKPQNVLILGKRSICAKISDMGISKHLEGSMSSLTKHATGYGTSGWQAPEQLANERQTRAIDLFSLGCVLFFCITGGKHPFGDNLERDINIVNNRKDLFLIDTIPEAVDLISRLLERLPESRPKAVDVLHHPLFWSSEMRLSFLRDASDRVELEDRENDSQVLKALESIGTVSLDGKWDEKLESAFINDIGRYRRYKYDSVRDLLRVIRNKLNHYRELPDNIQAILGQVPQGFDAYFSTRFPKLLTEVYKVILQYCGEEEFFHKYFKATQI